MVYTLFLCLKPPFWSKNFRFPLSRNLDMANNFSFPVTVQNSEIRLYISSVTGSPVFTVLNILHCFLSELVKLVWSWLFLNILLLSGWNVLKSSYLIILLVSSLYCGYWLVFPHHTNHLPLFLLAYFNSHLGI